MTALPAARPTIPTIVLTGGPCAGKSSAMAMLLQRLPEMGVTPIVVPELATLVFSSGLSPAVAFASPEAARVFQHAMVHGMHAQEATFQRFAALMPGPNPVLLLDRGVCDNRAYIDHAAFDDLLATCGTTLAAERDLRYDAVLHLTSAAKGAEAFYTTANNAARTETVVEAQTLDDKTLEAWLGHRRHIVIGNTAANGTPLPFEAKLDLVLGAVCQVLGLDVPGPVERLFAVNRVEVVAALPMHAVTTTHEQTYLRAAPDGAATSTLVAPPVVERRVRRQRTLFGLDLCVYTEKRQGATGRRVVTERVITPREYRRLLREVDPTRMVISKTRCAFIVDGQLQHVDLLDAPVSGLALLSVFTPDRMTVPHLPSCPSLREVTDDPAFRMAMVAVHGMPDRPVRGRDGVARKAEWVLAGQRG